MIKKLSLLLVIGILLSGCQPAELNPLPAINLPVRVALTPANSYLAQAVNQCSLDLPDLPVTVDVSPLPSIQTSAYDLIVTSGEGVTDWQYQLAQEELKFVINPQNPLDHLSRDQIISMLAGFTTSWQDVSADIPADVSADIIQVYLFPQADDVTLLLRNELPEDVTFNIRTRYLPGAAEITAAVSENKAAIGILPSRWLTGSVKPVATDVEISYPLVMSTQKEPAGSLRDLMGCIQSTIVGSAE